MYLIMLHGKTGEEETERKELDLQKGLVIDMKEFKMKVDEIKNDVVKFIIYDNEEVKDNQNIELKEVKRIFIDKATETTFKIGETYRIYLHTMVDWTLWLEDGEVNKGLYDKFNENLRKFDPNATPVTTADEFRNALEKMRQTD